MAVLIACEESQIVTRAFRALGVEAYSCDVVPTSGPYPQWHLQCDVLTLKQDYWDMVVSFPPCTDLAVSGARWFPQKRADGRQQRSIEFFMEMTRFNTPRFAIENPVGIMSTRYRKPDQIIQPWQFGHGETKATCLWLSNLPRLQPTQVVDGRYARVHLMGPSEDRAKLRSKTYVGIAAAMATQWAPELEKS